jgi:hypothetical protein
LFGKQKGCTSSVLWHTGNSDGGGGRPVGEKVGVVEALVGVAEDEAEPSSELVIDAEGWGIRASNVVGLPSLRVPTTRPTVGALELADVVPSRKLCERSPLMRLGIQVHLVAWPPMARQTRQVGRVKRRGTRRMC